MISLLQDLELRRCSTSGKPTCLCALCAKAHERVTSCIDVILLHHDFWGGCLEDLIQILDSRPKERPFGDREATDWLDMSDSKFRKFMAKMTDDMCNSIMLLRFKLQDLVRRFVRMECEELWSHRLFQSHF